MISTRNSEVNFLIVVFTTLSSFILCGFLIIGDQRGLPHSPQNFLPGAIFVPH